MPQAKYRIKRARLWDGREYSLGTEICFRESSLGAIFALPYADSGMHLTYRLEPPFKLNAPTIAEELPERSDLLDPDLSSALIRLGAGDLHDGLYYRILRAKRFVADPSYLKAVGISWLLPIPTSAGTFVSPLSGEVLDVTSLQPVSVEAPWQAPAGSVWASFGAEDPNALIWSVPFDQSVAVFLIPWFKCQKILRWYARQFVGPDGLLPSGEEFL